MKGGIVIVQIILDTKNSEAKCMDFMYWLSFTIWKGYIYLMIRIYPPLFISLIIISLPLGTRRYRCDHYRSWWNKIKQFCGFPIKCQGKCTVETFLF